MRQPYNPGLSDKAWKKLHEFLASIRVKYADALAKIKRDEDNAA